MTNLRDAAALGRAEHGLAVVSTLRADHTIQSTLVNAGIIDHPHTGRPALAFVTAGPVKRAHLRARPHRGQSDAFRSDQVPWACPMHL